MFNYNVPHERIRAVAGNWTEIRANTMAYYYFGQPKYWRQNEYPINSNYISTQEIFQLTNHLKPFNPFKP